MTSEQETAMYDQPSGVSREELIEEGRRHPPYHHYMMAEGEPANASEPGKTDIPTDDEREAVRAALEQNLMDSVGACTCDEAYTGRDLIDPNCGWHDAEGTADAESVDRVIHAFQRTVQGEPSDAAVLAALNARELSVRERSGSARHFNPAPDLSYYGEGNIADMRAALRAAAAVQGGETR